MRSLSKNYNEDRKQELSANTQLSKFLSETEFDKMSFKRLMVI